ncbi:DUF3868 domain-containing protein [Bacteroides sp.]|uniref:DUF3868 domain-containing protein n=1 Tax=Bacteroides sp. TaxID=29523 RepID=UPI003A8E3C77
MKRLHFTFILYTLLSPVVVCLYAQDNTSQVVRALLYRFERQDSCMVLDMTIDLREVHLAPDCTVCLYPWLRSGSDSLMLAPVMLNGPQSDRMYRRRRALGRVDKRIEKLPPYVVLREGDHPLPGIHYQKADIPYRSWMDGAEIVLHDESFNSDARLLPFRMETEKVPPVTIVRVDTVIIHDTVRIEKQVNRPVYAQATVPVAEKKKENVTGYAGYCADIYFPASDMKILPGHELNRQAWGAFVSELDSLRSGGGNTVIGITVTGYSSPEGSYESNEHIARCRAEALKNFLETEYDSAQIEIRTEWTAENWVRLAELVSASGMEDKQEVLDIIDRVSIFKGRESELKTLSGGKTWAYMLKEFFPALRYASCRIGYLKQTEK